MRRLALAVTLAGCGTMWLCGVVALASSISDSGKVKGATNSTVSLKVVIHRGKATKITGFSVTNVPAHCQGGPGTVSERFSGTLKIANDGTFRGKFIPGTMPPGQYFDVSGKVSRTGKKVSGTLSINASNPPPTGSCLTGKKYWTAMAP